MTGLHVDAIGRQLTRWSGTVGQVPSAEGLSVDAVGLQG
jgi:hypothetical protein